MQVASLQTCWEQMLDLAQDHLLNMFLSTLKPIQFKIWDFVFGPHVKGYVEISQIIAFWNPISG